MWFRLRFRLWFLLSSADVNAHELIKAIIRHAIDCWHNRVYYKKIYGEYYGGEGFYCDDKFDYWNYHDEKRIKFPGVMVFEDSKSRKAWNEYFDIAAAVKSGGYEIKTRFDNIQLLNEISLFIQYLKNDSIMSVEMCESIWNKLKHDAKAWRSKRIRDKIAWLERYGEDVDFKRDPLRLLYHAMVAKESRQFLNLQVPDNYVCVKCKRKGDHWIMNCSDDGYITKEEFVQFYCG